MSVKLPQPISYKSPANGLSWPWTEELSKRQDLIPQYTKEDETVVDLDKLILQYVKRLTPEDFNVTTSNMETMSSLFRFLGLKQASVPVGLGAMAKAPEKVGEEEVQRTTLTAEEIEDATKVLAEAAVVPPSAVPGKIDLSEPEITPAQQEIRIGQLVEGIGKLPPEGFRPNFGGLPLIKPLSDIVGFEIGLEEMKQAFDIYKEKKAAADEAK